MKVVKFCLKLVALLSISGALAMGDADSKQANAKPSLRGRDKTVEINRRLNPQSMYFCDCPGCDAAALDVYAGDYKCGARIDWLMDSLGFPEREACLRVASAEFPEECGACDPNTCMPDTPRPTPSPVAPVPRPTPSPVALPPPPSSKCGCPECEDVWNTMAGDYPCGSRIEWLQSGASNIVGGPFDESTACFKVASEEYPDECGKCDPSRCNAVATTPPSRNPTAAPTAEPTNLPTKSPTEAPTENPTPSPTAAPTTSPTLSPTKSPTVSPVDDNDNVDDNFVCGCSTCTDSVLNTFAGDYKCGDRMSYLQNSLGYSERDACAQVAGTEFPAECGGCDPERCDLPDYNNNNDNDNDNNSSGQKCGGAVNSSSNSETICQRDLWSPTGDSSMYCFAYGGSGDPCHLNNNNDPSDGRFKDPSACNRDTLYLWDEPDTQGRSYSWAGRTWLEYSRRFPQQLQEFRERGGKITSPLLKAGGPGVLSGNLLQFFNACGAPCSDPSDQAYIDIIAINAFCGDFNGPAGCRGGASFIYNEAVRSSNDFSNLPVYITNWSRLQTSNPQDQVEAIDAIEEFFPDSNSVVERVYWFGATDFGGGSSNNFLTQVLADGSTLGQLWRNKCDSL